VVNVTAGPTANTLNIQVQVFYRWLSGSEAQVQMQILIGNPAP
jgi:hypothetical protein